MSAVKTTHSGVPFRTSAGLVDLANLSVDAVSPELVADALSKVNRFAGRTDEPWPVATHSVLVAMLCPPGARALGLLHDAHEMFLGDLTSPGLDWIASHAYQPDDVTHAVKVAKENLDRRIFTAWGVSPSPAERHQVLHWDQVACRAEIAFFFDARDENDNFPGDTERAVDLICELLHAREWRQSKTVWLEFAQNLASIGHLRLPPPPAPSSPLPSDPRKAGGFTPSEQEL